MIEQGVAVEPITGRKFFLDYPCNLKRGEKDTFILALHGVGSYRNWQRNYFPLMDYKDKYRLVIARLTPRRPGGPRPTMLISRTSSTWCMRRSVS